jgi:UDP-glucose 4-epimerase
VRAVVTGERASSARTSSTRCSHAATRCTSSTTSRPGGRELNAAATLHELDIREPLGAVFAGSPESSFHLAAQADVGTSVERPVFDAEVNVLGTLNVLEAARAHGASVVFSSTGGAIYGECERPARRGRRAAPSLRTDREARAEEYLATWNALPRTAHVVLRFANVYGPRQLPKLEGGVVAIFIDRLRAGEGDHIYGDGEQTRDFRLRRRRRRRGAAADRHDGRRLQRRHRDRERP